VDKNHRGEQEGEGEEGFHGSFAFTTIAALDRAVNRSTLTLV
jgi:hypothetical protein